MADALSTNNYGIFDLGRAKQMVKNEPQAKAVRKAFQLASQLLVSVNASLRSKLLGPGQTPQGIIQTLGPFTVKDASQIDVTGYDVISDRAFLNFRTLREAQGVCGYLNSIRKES